MMEAGKICSGALFQPAVVWSRDTGQTLTFDYIMISATRLNVLGQLGHVISVGAAGKAVTVISKLEFKSKYRSVCLRKETAAAGKFSSNCKEDYSVYFTPPPPPTPRYFNSRLLTVYSFVLTGGCSKMSTPPRYRTVFCNLRQNTPINYFRPCLCLDGVYGNVVYLLWIHSFCNTNEESCCYNSATIHM